MIDFDVITGPNPSEKPSEAGAKPTPPSSKTSNAATLPRATLLPRVETPRPGGDAKSRP